MGNSLAATCCIDQSKVQDTLVAKKGFRESQEMEIKLKKNTIFRRETGRIKTY